MGAKSSSERGTDLHTSSFPLADAHRNAGALAIGPQTQLLLANGSSVLQLDFATKKTSLYAGKDLAGGCIDGHRLDQARFERVSSLIFVDSTIYLVDCDNCRIRSIKDDMVSCFAGNGSQFVQDGPRLNASFFYPWSIIHFLGRLFVSDIGGNNIRIISENGIVTTLGNQPGEAKWRWKTPLMSDEKKWRQERSKDKQAPTHLGSSGEIYQGLPPSALFEEGEGGALRISRPRSLAFRPQPDSPSAASRSHLLVTETLANGSSRILSLDLEAKEADVVCGWTENWTKVSSKPNKLKDSGVHSGSSTLPSSPTSYSSLHEDSPSHGDAQRSETKTKSGSSLNSSSSSNTTSTSSSSSSSTKVPLIGMIATTPHNPDEVIVSDEESHVLWRVSLIDGSSEILAGKHKSSGSKDGLLKSAKCDSPRSPCFAPSGDLMWIEASTKMQSPRIRYIREYGAITSALRLVDDAKKKGSAPVTVNTSTTTGNANSRSGDNISRGNGSSNVVVGPGGVTGSGEGRIDPLRSSTATGLGASTVDGLAHYQSSSTTATAGKDAASSSGQDSPSLNHSSLPSTPSNPSTTSPSSSACGVLDTLRGVVSSVSGSSSQPESPHTPPASPGGSQPILTPPPGGFQGFQPTRTTPRSTESTGEVRGEVSPIVLVTAWPSTSSASPNEPSNKGKEETPISPHQSSPHLLVASGVPTTQGISSQSPGEFSPFSSNFSSSSSSALAQSSSALNVSNASTVSAQTSVLSTSSGLSNPSSTTASTSTLQSSAHQNPVAHRPIHPVGGLSQSQGVYGGPTPVQWTTTKTPSSTSLSTQGSSPSASSTSPLPSTIHVNIGGSAAASGSPRYSHLQTSAPIPFSSSSSSLSNSSSSTGIVAPASVTTPSTQWGAAVPLASRTPPASPSSQSSSNSSLPSSPSATSTSSIGFMARQRSRPGDMGSGTGAHPNSSASSPSTANSQSHISSTATTTATTASSPTTGSISGSPSSPRTGPTGSPSSPAGLFSFSITHTSIGPSSGQAANQYNLKNGTPGHLSPYLHPGSSPYSSSSSTSSTSSISSITSLQPSAEAITDGWTFIHDE